MKGVSDLSSVVWTEESFEIESYTDKNFSTTHDQIKGELPAPESTLVSFERSSGRRKKCIICTIITIFILIIIAMIVAIVSLRKDNNTINQTSTLTNNLNDQTELTLVTTATTIYDVGAGGISGGPPCSSYTVIDDPSRNVDGPGIGSACDDGPLFNTSIGGRWIRFIGIGGVMIPSISPGQQHCGAYLAGWANMTLPSMTGIIVNGTVCFGTLSGECIFVIPISIVNCVTFYVYFLPPISICNARYCTI